MSNRVVVKNSVVAGKKPATAATNKPGELWVNVADRVIGTFDAAGAPVEVGVTAAKFTAGSIPFADTGGPLTEDNAALFWDKTNKRLGIGTKTPATAFHVAGQLTAEYIHFGTDNNLLYQSAPNTISFRIGTGANQSYLFANVTGLSTMLSASGGTFDLGFGSGATAVKTYSASNVGQHVWNNALSGVVSERMRLTADGQLLIGTATAPTVAGALLAVNSDAQINLMTVGLGGGRKYSNVALGNASLASNTTGTSNLAIGSNALTKNVDGTNCCGFGLNALSKNVSGTYNIGIGTQSLEANVSGSSNIGIGSSSLIISTGSSNVAIGFAAGKFITTGSGNVIIGGAGGEAAMNETIILSTGTGVERARFNKDGSLVLPGKTTAAIKALVTPPKGAIEFSIDENVYYYFDGAAWQKMSGGSSGLTLLPAVSAAAGGAMNGKTSFEFDGIPAGVKVVKLIFETFELDPASTLGDNIFIQLGTAASIVTTGYNGLTTDLHANKAHGPGFYIDIQLASLEEVSGVTTLTRVGAGSNAWVFNTHSATSTAARMHFGTGDIVLPGELTRLNVTTDSGTVAFKSGTIALSYE